MKNSYNINKQNGTENIFSITQLTENTRKNEENEETKVADFETAISATGFGKFNYLMLLIAAPAAWSSVFDTSSMSYVFPAAQCDLSLNLVNKGMLNAITYLGMISSAFLWGFLADTLGRRNLLVYGYLIDAICNVCCAFSQSFWMLLVFKYFSGFVICGPFAVLMSYLSEFHCTKYRSRVILMTGVFFSSANFILPCLAWLIMPQHININLAHIGIAVHSWHIFIIVCACPLLLAGFGYMFLPESPKFLMTVGRNKEALEVFQRVYAMNTGKPRDTFPIKSLVEETVENDETNVVLNKNAAGSRITANRSKKLALREGWQQIRPLFFAPYLAQISLVFFIYFGLLLGLNTLRLWLPQLFTTMDEYEQIHGQNKHAPLCEMLAYTSYKVNSSVVANTMECLVLQPNDQVYINSIIVALCSLTGYILVGFLVNILGKKILLFVMLFIGGVAGLANYWSFNWIMALVFSSIYVSLVGISCTTLISAIVELFPTSLRTMTISLTMMCGRMGSILGNLIFPILLQSGCLPPFLLIGGTCIVCAFLTLGIRSTAVVALK